MKRIVLCLSCLFVFSVSWSLQIDKIKVIRNAHTKTETILKLAPELNTNSIYPEDQLKRIIKRIKERLDITAWFYSADTYMVKNSADTNKVNIIIEVSEGFLYRISGGPVYGTFGMDNVFGGGEGYSIGLGWNMQYLRISDLFLPGNFLISAEGGNSPSGYYTNGAKEGYDFVKTQQIGGKIEAGYRFLFDTRLSFISSYQFIKTADYNPIGSFYQTGLKLTVDKSDSIFSSQNGFFAVGGYQAVLPLDSSFKTLQRAEADMRKYFLVLPDQKISMATRARVNFQFGEGVTSGVPDYLALSLAGIDGIRTLNMPGLIGNSTAEAHLELRWGFFQAVLFNTFNIDFETGVFGDAGTVSASPWNVNLGKTEYAYGIALRAYFGVPVYVPLRLELGWDRKGMLSVFFDVSAPF